MLSLLSEKPQYNDYMEAVSLMAPVAYLKHASKLYRYFNKFTSLLPVIQFHEKFCEKIIDFRDDFSGRQGEKLCHVVH